MSIQELAASVQFWMDLVAIFACAVCGACVAVRNDFDFFATAILALAASLGGGLLRDVVIGVRPIAFTEPAFYLTPLAAAAVVYFGTVLQRYRRAVDVFDAAALGLLSVTGTIKGLAHGFDLAPAAALGMATAVGGGLLCHVLAREVPPLLRWDEDLYALPAAVGAGTTALLHTTGELTLTTAACAAALAVGIRLLALHYGWRTPRSLTWRRRTAPPPPPTPPPSRPPLPLCVTSADTLNLRLPHRMGRSARPLRYETPPAGPVHASEAD